MLLIILDGLRPDSINPTTMPALSNLAESGVLFNGHLSAFPSKTRVVSATISTGCQPGTHGLINNQLFFPRTLGPVDASNYRELMRLDACSEGPLLSVPTLAEHLVGAGYGVGLATSSSSGTSLLQNPAGCDISVNTGYVLPGCKKQAIEELFGPAPEVTRPNTGQNRYAVSVLTDYILPELRPGLAILWLSDPDKTQHRYGPGAPETKQALGELDQFLREILDALEVQKMLTTTDLLIASDHGFISPARAPGTINSKLREWLDEEGYPSATVVSGNSLYLDAPTGRSVGKVIQFLQSLDETGALFSSHPATGTLPLSLLGLTHRRCPDIYYTPRWDDAPNRHGVPGKAYGTSGYGHGVTSPYEMNAACIGWGHSFQSGVRVEAPTAHTDLAPTILHLLECDASGAMQGRVLWEALDGGETSVVPDPVPIDYSVQVAGGDYAAYARFVRCGSALYFREANRRG